MKYRTTEDYLWDLKLSIIKSIPVFLTASLAFSQIFSSKQFAINIYMLLTFMLWLFFFLSILEIVMFGERKKARKK